MEDADRARAMVREAEQDVCNRKYHYEWTRTFKQAAEMLSSLGYELEAKHAEWMGRLMALPVSSKMHRRDGERSWFPVLACVPTGDCSDPHGITDEMLDYYAERCEDLTNPVLLARCCDIIWEKRKRQHRFARKGIDAHLSTASLFCERREWLLAVMHFDRALELARLINDSLALERVKEL